jgi:hypothetical protein
VRKPQVRQWEKRVGEIDRDLEYNLAAARRGAVDLEVLARGNAPLLEEKTRLRERIARAELAPATEADLRGLRGRGAREALAELPGLPIERQLAFLGRFFAQVELHPGHLRFVLAHPDLPAVICSLPRMYSPDRGIGAFEICFAET